VGAGMITGHTEDEVQQPVSAAERAARFSQTATAIALTGANGKEAAYQLERRLFDTGHATTILETEDAAPLIQAVKNAGLICLCVNSKAELSDMAFDSDKASIDDIYAALKAQKIIY
jgi:bifunctional enzyme CysN/CysC